MPRPSLGLAALLGAAGVACGDPAVAPPGGVDTTLTVLPRSALVAPNDTARFRAVVVTTAGDTLDPAVTWVSRDPTVAAVSADGLCTAAAVGSTWLVAAALDAGDSAFVTVAPSVALPSLRRLSDRLSVPLFLTAPPGDADRLFVVEKTGTVRIFRADTLVTRPFLNLSDSVSTSAGDSFSEQGLLSIAFHPDYAQNGFVYASFTDRRGDSQVVRYTVAPADPDSADPASASPVLFVDQPYGNHNGGLVAFGPDGMLYVALGDGGLADDPLDRAQNPDSLLGKILRLDVDGGTPYAIPPDNPFADGSAGRPEIWALGLRNPWRMSFDRATGDLYIADVGQGAREEVNVQPAASPGGENYGWKIWEGSICRPPTSGCSPTGMTFPAIDYAHTAGRCSVTGGYVYRGTALPLLAGRYLYADYCTGEVWSFTWVGGTATELLDWTGTLGPGERVTSFGEDARGELYLTTGEGGLYRIVPEASPVARP